MKVLIITGELAYPLIKDVVSNAVKIDKDGTVDLNHNKGKSS